MVHALLNYCFSICSFLRGPWCMIQPDEGRAQVAKAVAAQAGEEEGGVAPERSAYSDVVMGDEIWQTLEEIMTYMRDPMKYYDQGVLLPRVSGGLLFRVQGSLVC